MACIGAELVTPALEDPLAAVAGLGVCVVAVCVVAVYVVGVCVVEVCVVGVYVVGVYVVGGVLGFPPAGAWTG